MYTPYDSDFYRLLIPIYEPYCITSCLSHTVLHLLYHTLLCCGYYNTELLLNCLHSITLHKKTTAQIGAIVRMVYAIIINRLRFLRFVFLNSCIPYDLQNASVNTATRSFSAVPHRLLSILLLQIESKSKNF